MADPIIFGATPAAVILIGAVVLLLWLLLRASLKPGSLFTTVYEWEYGLLYINGRFHRVLPPGRYLSASFLFRRDIKTLRKTVQVHQSAVTDVTSEDKLAFRLAAQVAYRVVEPRTAFENLYVEQIGMAVRAGLVRVAAARTLESFMADRAAADADLLASIASPIDGCDITSVLINTVALPPEVRRLFVEIERAKLEGQAALERARGEHAALRSLANAAGLLKDNPGLMNLRLLQTAAVASGRGNLTLVVGQDGVSMGGAAQAAR
jgi:regulator of protease activity HflC (stomatin/prohibitin superfamily)